MALSDLYGMYQQAMYGGMTPLAYSYQQNYNAANQANEARYGDILTGLTGIYNRNMDRITSLGDQERADINRRANQNKAAMLADATARGYGASTVRNSLANKAEEDRNRALAQFRDQEIMRQINTDSKLAGDVYGVMERRNDVQPNMQNLVNVSQAAGAAGGGFPGMSGYGAAPGFPGVTGGQYTTFGPGSGGAGRAGLPGGPVGGYTNYGPGSGGAGMPGMTPSYGLPGGQMSTPLPIPQSAYGNYGPGMGGAGGGDRKLQQQLRNAMLREIQAYGRPQQSAPSNSRKPFISATPDLGGSLPTYNKAPWQNQDISFGGPSVGGAYILPGNPVPLANYQATSFEQYRPMQGDYPSYTTMQRPRTGNSSGMPVQRPAAAYQPTGAREFTLRRNEQRRAARRPFYGNEPDGFLTLRNDPYPQLKPGRGYFQGAYGR